MHNVRSVVGRAALSAVVVIAILIFVFAAAGCSDAADEPSNLGTEFTPYDEAAFASSMASPGENRIKFSDGGESEYSLIVCPEGVLTEEGGGRSETELRAAAEYFRTALERVTGAAFALSEEDPGGKAIRITLDADCGIERGGHGLTIAEEGITFVSSDADGLTAALYAFLEERLGCMFVSPEYDYIPRLDTVYLDAAEEEYVPSVQWRYVYSDEADVPKNDEGQRAEYGSYRYSKLRLNGAANNDWYAWVHTSFTYVPPEEYFDEHPEYFSLYRGRRTYEQGPVSGQLCWTNEEVYEIISDKVLQQMRENPDKHIWDISQMDTWESRGVGCECDACKEIDEREGTQMGSLLTFINRLADEVKAEFPDNYISTLAYNYTAQPPETLRPRDNVIIKLCLMPGDCASSYADPQSSSAKKAHDLVEAWGKVAEHIVIWDYNIDFHNYMMPYPILDQLRENNEFYLDNNVYGMFHQMSADKGGDMAELNSYIFARLMWDRDVDVQALFDKYLTVYYGAAAPYIAEYYGDLASNLERSGDDLYIYAPPVRYSLSYLSSSAIDGYLAVLGKAEQAVADDPALLARVEAVEKSVLFVKAAQFSADMSGRSAALEKFVRICADQGVTSLLEGEGNGDEIAEFYNGMKTQINAIPAIVIAMIVGAALFAVGIAALCVSVYSKIKYGKFDFRKTMMKKNKTAAVSVGGTVGDKEISDAERENKEGS